MLIEDLISARSSPGGRRRGRPGRGIMTAHPVSVGRGADVEQCIEKMGTHEVRRILVLDDEGELEGVVSLDDIVMHLSNTLEKAATLIRAEVARI